MPMTSLTDLIDDLHASPWLGVLAITGGGSGAINGLLERPGASGTLLEANVPYCETSLAEWIHFTPEQACCERTARQMAMVSFQRARHLSEESNSLSEDSRRLFGLGATASLATDRPKRGEHRLHVAVQTSNQTITLHLQFEKGVRSRVEEEGVATHAIIALLGQVAGVHSIDLSRSPSGIETLFASAEVDQSWSPLLLDSTFGVKVNNSEATGSLDSPKIVFPGSFNPLHAGHRQMASQAESLIGSKAWFEISVRNVDKPPLDFMELKRRIETFEEQPLLLTNAPTFVEKAKLYPGCHFVVGIDTLKRIAETRYYAEGLADRDAAILSLQKAGCRFLAFGRTMENRFYTADEIKLPPILKEMTDSVAQEDFRCDVSSTQLRNES